MAVPFFGGECEPMKLHRNTAEFLPLRHCCDRQYLYRREWDDPRHGDRRREPFELKLRIPGEHTAVVELLDDDGQARGRSVCRGGTLRISMESLCQPAGKCFT